MLKFRKLRMPIVSERGERHEGIDAPEKQSVRDLLQEHEFHANKFVFHFTKQAVCQIRPIPPAAGSADAGRGLWRTLVILRRDSDAR